MATLRAHASMGVVSALLTAWVPFIHAATLRVPQDYADIRSAVTAAVNGDRVLVSDGIYGSFRISQKNIEVTSVNGPASTVVNVQGVGTNVILLEYSSSHVHGFTVSGGWTDDGAGISVSGGSPEINNMIVTGNEGGGIIMGGSSARVHHNHVTGNNGKGIFIGGPGVAKVYNNLIENNYGGAGGGVTIIDNWAAVVGNIIRGNMAGVSGGGVFVHTGTGPGRPKLANNLIVENTSREGGGGITILTWNNTRSLWVNNTIANNKASNNVGNQARIGWEGHWSDDNEGIVFANNVFAGEGLAIHCYSSTGKSPVFDHNDVYPGADGPCEKTAVEGSNISVPPDFVVDDNGRPYHLSPDSPLVDAGSNRAARKLHRDLGNRPRVIDGGHGEYVDIGAHEYRPK